MAIVKTTLSIGVTIAFLMFIPLVASAASDRIGLLQNTPSGAIPIVVLPFDWQGKGSVPDVDIGDVIRSDFENSGRFHPMPLADMAKVPISTNGIDFQAWTQSDVRYLIKGNLAQSPSGDYLVDYWVSDVSSQKQLMAYQVSSSLSRLRYTAHFISDSIFQKLTGLRGAFATRIAYVANSADGRYSVVVSGSDGFNAQQVGVSGAPLMPPAWSPDGKRIAYVSLENEVPGVYLQTLSTGKRTLLIKQTTLNSTVAFSPDGQSLAVTMEDGSQNTDLYILDISTQKLTNVTNSGGVLSGAAWSPDGQNLYFTSQKGGTPEIYLISRHGGKPQLVTTDGNYNTSPAVSPDGKLLAMVHQVDGHLRIAVMPLAGGDVRMITSGLVDESPSFSPNSDMIIYQTAYLGHPALAKVTVDGQFHSYLTERQTDSAQFGPAWGPFLENGQ